MTTASFNRMYSSLSAHSLPMCKAFPLCFAMFLTVAAKPVVAQIDPAPIQRVSYLTDPVSVPILTGTSSSAFVTLNPPPVEAAPELTANPGRPSMSTPATLTPVGYLQFENGFLYASGSGEFTQRGGEEETVKLTVIPRVQFLLSAEPMSLSANAQPLADQAGDVLGGVQVVLSPGQGMRPTISASYLRLVRSGTASNLDIGGFVNGSLAMCSADLGHFHVDANGFLNEQTDGRVRRAQFGESVALSHPLTARLGATAELRHFTQPLTGGDSLSMLWAADYTMHSNLVLDASVARGMTGTSTGWAMSSGFTYVLPRRLWGAKAAR